MCGHPIPIRRTSRPAYLLRATIHKARGDRQAAIDDALNAEDAAETDEDREDAIDLLNDLGID